MTPRMQRLLAILKSATADDIKSLAQDEAMRIVFGLDVLALAVGAQLERPLSQSEDAETTRVQ